MHSEKLTLALWEGAVGRRGSERDEVLLGAAPRSLQERNLLALTRYTALFGSAVELTGRCKHCSASVEFVIDVARCADTLAVHAYDASNAEPVWHELTVGEASLRFRLPLPADVHALSVIEDADEFAEALLARCMEGRPPVDAEVRDAVSRRMDALMEGASLRFSLGCPDCGGAWEAPLDPVDLLWRELRLRAELLLADVAVLARAFGWSERDILELGPVRRAAYLQLGAA